MKFWNKSLAAILALAVAIVAWRTSPDIGQLIKSHASPSHAVAADPAKAPAITTLYLGGQPFTCRNTRPAVVTCTIPRGLVLGDADANEHSPRSILPSGTPSSSRNALTGRRLRIRGCSRHGLGENVSARG